MKILAECSDSVAVSLATVFLLILTLFPTGCASPAYMVNRGRDAADIFSLSVGAGIGAKARVGPVGTGILLDSPLAGLRGGDWLTKSNFNNPGKPIPINNDLQLLVAGGETFLGNRQIQARGKAFTAGMVCGLNVPTRTDVRIQSTADGRASHARSPKLIRYSPGPYLTQIEFAGGLGLTLRAGFNPGELLDFALGWVGFDLFGDDIELEPPPPSSTEQESTVSRQE